MSQPSAPDPFEFMKTLWGPMGLPLAGMVVPTLDVSEIEKRISDLKSVELWLTMNLNILKMGIQGLEMQKATLSAMQGTAGEPKSAGAESSANPFAEAWWSALQAQAGKREPTDKK